MTDIERHAELVYAETLFEKALLGTVYSGDWLAFVKEVLVVCYSHFWPISYLTLVLVSICERLSPSIVNSDNTLTP